MSTPITDAATCDCYLKTGQMALARVVAADVARRLELDRAALKGALEAMEGLVPKGSFEDTIINNALSTARANFP